MKPPAIVLMCVVLLASGCERRKASDTPPEGYDPDLKAAPSFLDSGPDEDLLGDQAAISRRIERDKLVPAAPTPSEGASEASVEQVKQMLAPILSDVQSGQTERILEIYTDRMAASMRTILVEGEQIDSKLAELGALVKERLRMDLPEKLKSTISDPVAGTGLGAGIIRTFADELQFDREDTNVVVTLPDGERITFAPADSGYKAYLPPELSELPSAAAELVTATIEFLDEITAAVSRGQITAADFDEKTREIAQQTYEPAAEKLTKLITSAPIEGLPGETEGEEESEETTSPAPEAARSGETSGTLRRVTIPPERSE